MTIPDITKRGRWRLRLIFALTTSIIVTVTAYFAGWNAYRSFEWSVYSPQGLTFGTLRMLSESVELHRQAAGRLPATLDELDIVKNQRVPGGRDGRATDYWDNPLHYGVSERDFVIFSFGADGQPGGTGNDADLFSDRESEFTKMTFWEYASTSRTIGMRICCLVAGLIALVVCLIPSQPTSRAGYVKVFLIHTITAVFAILFAAVISVLHLPSGH